MPKKKRGVWKWNEREYRGLRKVQQFNEAIVEKKREVRKRNFVAATAEKTNLKILQGCKEWPTSMNL